MFHVISLYVENYAFHSEDIVTVSLMVEFPVDPLYSSVDFSIDGFHHALEYIDTSTDSGLIGEAGWDLIINNTDSVLYFAGAGANDISGSGSLCSLIFYVPRNSDPEIIPITLSDAVFNNGETPVILSSGSIRILPEKLIGDVDLNGELQAYDASLILKHIVGSVILTNEQLSLANVTQDTSVSSLDASVILQYVVQLVDSLPHNTSDSSFFASGDLTMADAYINPGDTIEIPIILESGENIFSYSGSFNYNSSHVNFIDFKWSEVLNNFNTELRDTLQSLHFAGADIIGNNINSEFATLVFKVSDDINVDSTIITLKKLRWNEDEIKDNSSFAVFRIVSDLESSVENVPKSYKLYQNFPNPFNPKTVISYQLPVISDVDLSIYNLLGQKIVTLVSEKQKAGYHQVEWDATGFSSGVYYYKIEAGNFVETRKMVYLK